MGWFTKVFIEFPKKAEFSSPLGDGLVLLEKKGYIKVAKYFRPRLGMGWFPEDIKSKMQYFRPRLGMGWFISISLYVIWFRDFRPRLGMGWFVSDDGTIVAYYGFSSPSGDGLVRAVPMLKTAVYPYFRPRVGMGWFLCRNYLLKKLLQFSSPSGVGLVHDF